MPSVQISRIRLSRKKRFEIFKRDGFKCQYCGSHPPDKILEIDHVLPICHGGNNADHNLITSCFDCNRGKGGKLLSDIAITRRDVRQIAEREAQIQEYRRLLEIRHNRIDADARRIFSIMMPGIVPGEDWISSIKGFMNELEYEELMDSAEIAFRKNMMKNSKTFSYFCGVCWRKIERKKNVL